jgi:hypothetical protein
MKRILLISLLLLAVICTVSADRRRLLGVLKPAAAGGATLLPLEEIAVAAYGAWSVGRNLTNSWTGALALVVRSSDKATNYLVSSGTGNNISTILSWAGSDSVYVTNLFDQTGNGRHFTNGNTNICPLIVQAGTELSKNGHTVLKFLDDDYLFATASPSLPLTFLLPVFNDSRTSGDFIFAGNSTVRTAIKQGSTAVYTLDSGGAGFNTSDALNLDVYDFVTAIFKTGDDSGAVNNGTPTTGAAGDNAPTGFILGYPSQTADMRLADMFIYNAELTAPQSGAVRTNVTTFYSLP